MKFTIIFILSCFCVNFSTSSVEVVADVDKNENTQLLKLMYETQTPQHQQRAGEEFRQKYGEHSIEISYVSKDDANILISNGKIFVHFELVSQFLKSFSGFMKKLSIAYHLLPSGSHKEIGRLVNVHCSDTLKEFQAKNCENGAFDEMKKPFTNVTDVVFDGDWWEHSDDQLGLDKLFPEMRVFNFTYSGGYIYNRHYPHLVEVNTFATTAFEFGGLIEKNPQIKKLRVEETTMGFLNYVSEKVPNLETLAFNVPYDLAQYQEPAIQFKQVNDLSINDFHHHIKPGKFIFNNLKHFELLVDGNIKDEWINFIGNNKGLESLSITTGFLNSVTLASLSKKFTGLLKAKVNCDSAVSVKDIADFINNNHKMREITLNLERGSSAFFKDLIKRLGKQWKVTPFDMGYTVLNATWVEPYTASVEASSIEDNDFEINLEPVNIELDDSKKFIDYSGQTLNNNLSEYVEPSYEVETKEESKQVENERTDINESNPPEIKIEYDESAEDSENIESAAVEQTTEGVKSDESPGNGSDLAKSSCLAVLAIATIILFA